MSCKIYEFVVDPNDKVLVLREKIHEEIQFPINPHDSIIFYQGKRIFNDKTLSEQKVVDGSVLHLIISRGR
ncbi:MAG: hypothetical protein EZS28_024816 [Streblomastix strix]|uniref:Ubiquitin-like domain-containing protein n=1 Tax=Streblomastix strix TaxID=222440 RepID=A0A5J4VB34_9EUKA|nr:MAG: hypothetical protein EZS28_024816 [Streblomastix strix]